LKVRKGGPATKVAVGKEEMALLQRRWENKGRLVLSGGLGGEVGVG